MQLNELWDLFTTYMDKGSAVLDLGCGAGHDLKELAARGFQPRGLDYSAPLADIARDHSGQDVHVCAFEEMPFDSDSFDAVWAVASLLHVTRDAVPNVLAKINHILKSGGILLTSMQQGIGKEFSGEGRLFELYQSDEWEGLLVKAGFEVIDRNKTNVTVKTAGDDRKVTWLANICRKK